MVEGVLPGRSSTQRQLLGKLSTLGVSPKIFLTAVGKAEWTSSQLQSGLLGQLQCHNKDLSVYLASRGLGGSKGSSLAFIAFDHS